MFSIVEFSVSRGKPSTMEMGSNLGSTIMPKRKTNQRRDIRRNEIGYLGLLFQEATAGKATIRISELKLKEVWKEPHGHQGTKKLQVNGAASTIVEEICLVLKKIPGHQRAGESQRGQG